MEPASPQIWKPRSCESFGATYIEVLRINLIVLWEVEVFLRDEYALYIGISRNSRENESERICEPRKRYS